MVIRTRRDTPLHDRIRLHLLAAIKNGRLAPGDRVPSEWELAERFAVSRMTARQAVSELERLGYLQRHRGKGTFVAPHKLEQPLSGLTGFTEAMQQRGLKSTTRVLAAGTVPAERGVAMALGLAETVPVYRLERLRLADSEPVALEVSHIPVSLAPDLMNSGALNQSLYRLLQERFAIRPTRATQILEVTMGDPRGRELLCAPEATPLLLLQRITRDETDRPVEYVRSLCRGDRFRFTTQMVRWKEGHDDG